MLSANLDAAGIFETMKSVSNAVKDAPILGPALQICMGIVQLVQGVGANQLAMVKLCEYAALFVKSVAEHARNNINFSNSLKADIDSITNLFGQIQRFVERQNAKSFVQQVVCQAKTAEKIRQFQIQISQLSDSLQVAVAFDSNSIIFAIQNDTKALTQMMLEIKNSNEAMNATMNEMLSDTKLQSKRIETLASINDEICAGLKSLPDQIRDVMKTLLPVVQDRLQQSTSRKLSPHFDWSINPDDVDIDYSAKIGEGGFGTIYKATFDGLHVVVKIIDKPSVNQEAVTSIEKEASVWHPLRHPNILPLWGVCMNTDKPFLVMPLMKSDLSNYLAHNPDLDMQTRIKFIASIASGVKYLHSRASPIIHGDIKANNVLIGLNGEICITDFGLSFIKTMSKSNTKNQTGAARWIAPEKYKKRYKLSPPSDVFAFSMACIEIITGKPPFFEQPEDDIVKDWIKDGERPDRPENVPDALWSLIEDCWHQDPEKRPTFSEIVDRFRTLVPDLDSAAKSNPFSLHKPIQFVAKSVSNMSLATHVNTFASSAPVQNDYFKNTIHTSSSPALILPDSVSVSETIRRDVSNGKSEACMHAAKVIARSNPTANDWSTVFILYHKAATAHDLEACFELAWLYFAGIGVEKNYAEAFSYWQRVQKESKETLLLSISTYMLGWCHYMGYGTHPDQETGMSMFDASSQHGLDLCKLWTLDLNKSYRIDVSYLPSRVSASFFEHVSFGAETDEILALLTGVCYLHAFGIDKDQSKAVEIFKRLADDGLAMGQVALGCCYRDATGVQEDFSEALRLFTAAAKSGDSMANHNLGICHYYGHGTARDCNKAVEWWRKGASQGNAKSQFTLGVCYRNGEGVEQNHFKTVELWTNAAQRGSVGAASYLGCCFRDGKGVPPDPAKAFYYLKKAADQGVSSAQCNLGYAYEYGQGVERDPRKAFEMYQKAALQGHVYAQYYLALCYREGKAVQINLHEAAKWFKKASDQGHDHSKAEYKRLSQRGYAA